MVQLFKDAWKQSSFHQATTHLQGFAPVAMRSGIRAIRNFARRISREADYIAHAISLKLTHATIESFRGSMKKNLEKIKTDRSAISFLDTDISDYIHSGNFKKVNFELYPKDQTITIRISKLLMEALKRRAKAEGISYQKLMRRALEKVL